MNNYTIIGLGRFGKHYLRLLGEHVTQVVEPKPTFSTGSISCLESVNNMEVGGVRSAFICSPATLHYQHVKIALEKGYHVFCEKPLALKLYQANELFELAESKSLLLYPGQVYIHNPYIQFIKNKFFDQKLLGDFVYGYCTRTNFGPVRDDVPPHTDLAYHDLATLAYLTGEKPDNKLVEFPDFNKTGTSVLNCFLGQANAIILSSWAEPHKTRLMKLRFKQGQVVFDELADNPLLFWWFNNVSNTQHIPTVHNSVEHLQHQINHYQQVLKFGPDQLYRDLKRVCLQTISSLEL